MLAGIYRFKQKLNLALQLMRWSLYRLTTKRCQYWLLSSPANGEPGEAELKVVVQGHQPLAENCFSYFMGRRGEMQALSSKAAAEASADLLISEPLPWQARQSNLFSTIVHASRELEGDIDSYVAANLSSTLRRRLKKALKTGYNIGCSKTKEDLADFFHQLYQPMVRRRHGVNSLPASEEYFTSNPSRVMDKFLITLRLDSAKAGDADLRAAAVVYHDTLTRKLILDAYGFSSELLDDAKAYEQAFTLINYEFLKKAYQLDVRVASLGESDNTMTAGSFYYKRQWGMQFDVKAQYLLRHHAVCFEALTARGWQQLFDRPVFRQNGERSELMMALPSENYSPDALLQQLKRGLLKDQCDLRLFVPEGLDQAALQQQLQALDLQLHIETFRLRADSAVCDSDSAPEIL
ncbi:hypothetical protein [Marinobacterium jannaschii]|uniref:hypothetical protein n=1 Tax=Marinobacterium jannaschii TaxID=64970 RepID=UPI0004827DE1|nr:hypothetical protein [Marinobacterium jannaschii]